MREIVLDTETTGLKPEDGHRIVEIGCVELIDHVPSGQVFHRYLNPQREMPEESVRIHGLTAEFLADKPAFADIAEELFAFIADAPLVIHNAEFDLKFLNTELERIAREPIPSARAIDTIEIAKRRFPGARYSLDELCRRFAIDLSARDKHGALIDAELTAQVYLELIGGRQTRLALAPGDAGRGGEGGDANPGAARSRPEPLPPRVSAEERARHRRFVAESLGRDPLWKWD